MNSRSARVLQLNVARCNTRVHSLLNACKEFDICILQDPWWGPIGHERSTTSATSRIFGTVSAPEWYCFFPPYSNSANGPGVAVYLALDLSVYGFKCSLVNLYFHGSTARAGLGELLDHPADLSRPVIYAGDFNLHHQLWALPGARSLSQAGPAADLAEWITSNNMTIMNRPGLPTRHGQTGQQDSVIDLTIANPAAFELDVLSDWETSNKWNLGSDHFALTWTLSAPIDTPFIPPEPTFRYSIDAGRKKEWTKAFEGAIAQSPTPAAYHSQEDCQIGA
jgi:hypothetical protein